VLEEMKLWLVLVSVALFAFWVAPAKSHTYMALELEAEILDGTAHDYFSIFFHFEDYRTVPGVTTFTVTLEFRGQVVGSLTFDIFVPSGFRIKRQLTLPIPEDVPLPPGDYELCLMAERDPARYTACATVTLDGQGRIVGFSKERMWAPKDKGDKTSRVE
jgi:hypothetical protein